MMGNNWPIVPLGKVLTHRKKFITIDDTKAYKRCRVQLHAQGIVPRDLVSGAEIKTKNQQVCRAGEFLVAEIDAKVGGYGIVPQELEGAIVSSHYFLFEIDEALLDRRFLGYYIRTPAFRDQVSAQGSTNYAAIRPQHVLEYKMPLPSFPEQQRIVVRIQDLAAKIEEAKLSRQQAMVENESLMDSAVGTIFSKIRPIEIKPLAKLVSKIGSGSTPKGGRASYPLTGVPFVRSLNVRMRKFQWDGVVFIDQYTHEAMKGTRLQPNDVLLNITGASIGRVACVPENLLEANINQHTAIIRPKPELHHRYLMYWLSQPSVQDFINNEQKGATRQGFTKAQIEEFKMPVISLTEQKKIIDHLDALQSRIDEVNRFQDASAAELDALLPSILDKAFKGEL